MSFSLHIFFSSRISFWFYSFHCCFCLLLFVSFLQKFPVYSLQVCFPLCFGICFKNLVCQFQHLGHLNVGLWLSFFLKIGPQFSDNFFNCILVIITVMLRLYILLLSSEEWWLFRQLTWLDLNCKFCLLGSYSYHSLVLWSWVLFCSCVGSEVVRDLGTCSSSSRALSLLRVP